MKRFYSAALGTRDRSNFTSGNEKIDAYFRNGVGQDIKRNYAACHVIVEASGEKIAGFYTLSACSIPLNDIPSEIARKLPRYPSVPAVLIGWLARDLEFSGESVGEMLLYDAAARVCAASIGAHAIFVDAIDGRAAAFYRKHLFTPLASSSSRLFLPLATARKAIDTA